MRETIPEELKWAGECAAKLVGKFPQLEPLVIAPLLRREATIAFHAFIERITKAEARNKVLEGLLQELAALVRGESPRLLDEDCGGDADLSWKIDAALREDR